MVTPSQAARSIASGRPRPTRVTLPRPQADRDVYVVRDLVRDADGFSYESDLLELAVSSR